MAIALAVQCQNFPYDGNVLVGFMADGPSVSVCWGVEMWLEPLFGALEARSLASVDVW